MAAEPTRPAEVTIPEVLWRPDPDRVAGTAIARFGDWVRERGIDLPPVIDEAGYAALHEWSVTDLDGFWGAIAEFFGVRFHDQPESVLADDSMPGARWFPGATLNYAEQALAPKPGRADDDEAVLFAREDGLSSQLTFGELRGQVAAARAALRALGVGRGDRVVAMMPNCPQTLVAFLATASIGAIWSSCSPDFGSRAVVDRFSQLEPTVLIAVDGYLYGGKSYRLDETIGQVKKELTGLTATIHVRYLDSDQSDQSEPTSENETLDWEQLLAEHAGVPMEFESVPFDHPLWILYSSGTTGLPKGIVHSHGGIVLELVKKLGLACDLGPGDRFFWFTTTSWMMWNFLVSGLLAGVTIVLYDGSPGHPDLMTLWRLAEKLRITYFGTSAPFIQGCLKKGLKPNEELDLSAIRGVGSTGSPLSTDGFRWISESVGDRLQIGSTSGGTDLCTAFVGPSPVLPVWLGEISCATLGAAVAAFDESGHPVVNQVGELVLTRPMPSMPVAFWNDPDGSRLRAAYFEYFPGVWRHGDWISVSDRGSCVIYGRSDSTLNRGGIRMGTAEFYRVVEGFDEITDSLVIDTTRLDAGGAEGELICFLVLAPNVELADIEPKLSAALRAELSPRHVPNRYLPIREVPRTLNGKKSEVPVKRVLTGTSADEAVSRDSLANPTAFDEIVTAASPATRPASRPN